MLECHSCVEEAATKIIYWRRDGEREPQCVKEEKRREKKYERKKETKVKKSKDKEKEKRESRDKGNVTKVIDFVVQY
jgi:hypothetical protein